MTWQKPARGSGSLPKKLIVTVGPFAETKEWRNPKEEAIEPGKQFMNVHGEVLGAAYEGELEIRQMMERS